MDRIVNRLLTTVVSAFMLCGCAITLPGAEQLSYQSRAVTRTEGGLHVSASVLSAEESESVYGVPLAKKGIQPVWIEVRNDDTSSYFLMSPGLDPNFFPASEAAEAFASGESLVTGDEIERRFRGLAFRNPVLPAHTAYGYILTNLSEGAKLIQLDLVASGRAQTFSFLIVVPGFYADYHVSAVFRREIYPPGKIVDYTGDSALRAALESLPCCATSEDGATNGDPLNLVIVGGLDDAFPALVRRGWSPTEQKWSGSIMKTVTSAFSGERYVNAPVSDLYLFGRAQDLALQKARDTIHQRNHLRLWLSPMRYRGKPVWVGQISRDIGVRLTFHSPTLTTHKIDPDVDEARTALTEDMAYSQNLQKIGFVKGVGAARQTAPGQNLTTDPYYTDGYRQVLVFDRQPTSLSGIEFFPWESIAKFNAVPEGADQ
ncbi:LssY C-terminal domain-containing protein [Paraburkholderia sp. SIMBA_053]|uniref:LssY C-terminal domain-containing protein n=1 Tax=Paraburkholderia sp. SIMBA_053 TaxID=3085794 RepID=UPI00397C1112